MLSLVEKIQEQLSLETRKEKNGVIQIKQKLLHDKKLLQLKNENNKKLTTHIK